MTTKDIRNHKSGDDLPRYGMGGAGYRDDDASRDGARKVNRDGTRATQCDFALAVVDRFGEQGVSAYGVYETADAPFRDLSTCRARLSDLKAQGKIVKKGERTPGEAGVAVNLWIAARFAPPAPPEAQADMFAETSPATPPARAERVKLTLKNPKGIIGGLLAAYSSSKAA